MSRRRAALVAAFMFVGGAFIENAAGANQSEDVLLKKAACFAMAKAWSITNPGRSSTGNKEIVDRASKNLRAWSIHFGQEKATARKKGDAPDAIDLHEAEDAAFKSNYERLRAGDYDNFINEINQECVPIMPEVEPFTAELSTAAANGAQPAKAVATADDDVTKSAQCLAMASKVNQHIMGASDLDRETKKRSITNMTTWAKYSKGLQKNAKLDSKQRREMRKVSAEAGRLISEELNKGNLNGGIEMLNAACLESMPEIEPFL